MDTHEIETEYIGKYTRREPTKMGAGAGSSGGATDLKRLDQLLLPVYRKMDTRKLQNQWTNPPGVFVH